jgi:uncharacterized protein YjbI with pentapeptide repeats
VITASARLWWKKIKPYSIVMLLHSCWRQIMHLPFAAIVLPILGALALTILIGGYRLNLAWTGFTGTTESYETLYDWLQLLFVPVALTGFGFFLRYRERKAAERHADKERQKEERRGANERKIEGNRAKTERDIAEDNQQEEDLQAYTHEISELLLHENLRKSEKDAEVRNIARVRTLTVLPRLNSDRKGSALQFLHESGLIHINNTLIVLRGADLSEANLCGDISWANLKDVNLNGANLTGASMSACKVLYWKKLTSVELLCLQLTCLMPTWKELTLTMLLSFTPTSMQLALTMLISVTHYSIGAKYNGKYLQEKAKSLKGAYMYDVTEHP